MHHYPLWYSRLFVPQRYSAQLVLNVVYFVVALPLIVYRALRDSTRRQIAVDALPLGALQKQFAIAERTTDPSIEAIADLSRKTTAWIEAADWEALDKHLRTLDQSRAHALDGARLAPVMLNAAWAVVRKDIVMGRDDWGDYATAPIPFDNIAPFIEAAQTREDAYALNALVAWLCLKTGWSARGGAMAALTSNAQFEKMTQISDAADVFLDWFDAEELSSPLLAQVNYERLTGMDTDLHALTEAYQLWRQLDPSDPAVLQQHGVYLLPRWYGDDAILDDVARAAYAQSKLTRDAADYATMYLPLLHEDDGAREHLDLALFEQGLHDMLTHAADPQATLNTVLETLHRAILGPFDLGETPVNVQAYRDALGRIYDELVKSKLNTAIPQRWQGHRKEMLYALARAFRNQIASGDVVKVGNP